ncbi:MAG: 2Fe-2S iron-sulfur cluster binding domain-containing protein [Candidatus Atribacteria bacterium]|nr:MAG: 2Fe-2S iron-sulfur cluster binding domain-containing protein [Candidatus Atribacteria bacterium]
MSELKNQMCNTHILVNGFDYIRPATIADALAALADHPEAKLLAGGTNLVVDMKLEAKTPPCVIDITQLPELHGFEISDAGVDIGALTSIRDIATSRTLWDRSSCLAESAAAFGSTQIMMMGTLGGNIANGSPASDTVPALVVLGAEATILGPTGERTALIVDLLKGPGEIALHDGELISRVRIPQAPAHTGSSFLKLSRVRADLAKVSVAVRLVRDGDKIVNARIALGSVGPTVVRAKKASSMLSDRPFSKDLILNAARMAGDEIKPIDDVRSTADYRKRAAVALVHDALLAAWERASGKTWQPPMDVSQDEWAEPILQQRMAMNVGTDDSATIELIINGEMMEIDVSPNELLLNVLRERLELTGTKYGCGIGECGACTVWLNGTPILGCLVLAISADGGEVRTIEGLAAPDGTLDPIQQAFIDENAFQCGYCTPGMLMMTKKLLEEISEPSEDDVRDYLKGNHCRCTGYASIVRAVRLASGEAKA